MKKYPFLKSPVSKITIFIILITWAWTSIYVSKWGNNNVIIHDVVSYYSYLPALFIYHDLTFKFTDKLPDDFEGEIWYLTTPNGDRVQKMSMGLSVLYSPFFFIAHQIGKISHYPANGYSKPYSLFLVISSLFYAVCALFILRKVLMKYFTDKVTAITLFITSLGTNLFFYVSFESAMSHSFSFFLFSLLILLTIKWHEKPRIKHIILMGISAGLIILTRPSNSVMLLIPLFYNVYSRPTLKQKAKLLKQYFFHILIFVTIIILVFCPQLIYWKKITGNWLYYSYGKEKFFFENPHIIKGLFSYRKGWLVYTPVMIFALTGIPLLFKKLKTLALPVGIYFITNIFIVFSWWCWWYGGSFGMRALIESYAILTIPLACFIQYSSRKNLKIKITSGIIITSFILLNLFQTYQYNKVIIHWDSMSKNAYWAVFGKIYFPENYQKLLIPPDYENAIWGKKEKTNNK